MRYFLLTAFFVLFSAFVVMAEEQTETTEPQENKEATQPDKNTAAKQLRPFVPSEEITADSVISLPTDI